MLRALVTGGTGFIGRHLVKRLLQEGVEVRCLVRSPGRATHLRSLGATVLVGDVTSPSTLFPAVTDTDVVYHLAGATLAFNARAFHQVNSEGTTNLATACARLETPPVLLYVSSLAAAGPSSIDRPRSEEDPPAPVSHYGLSKRAGELRLHRFAQRVPITVLRPPIVFGPHERYLLGLFRFASFGWQPIPYFGPAQLSFIHVSDLVEALLVAVGRGRRLLPLESSQDSGIYHVAGPENLTLEELAQLLATALGRPSGRSVRIPGWLCRSAAALAEIAARMAGRQVLLNPDKMREAVAGSWTCRVDRAAHELGFRCAAPLQERLQQTADWYLEHGWL